MVLRVIVPYVLSEEHTMNNVEQRMRDGIFPKLARGGSTIGINEKTQPYPDANEKQAGIISLNFPE